MGGVFLKLVSQTNQLEAVMYGKYREELKQELENITESGLYKSERHITSAQQARINVAENRS